MTDIFSYIECICMSVDLDCKVVSDDSHRTVFYQVGGTYGLYDHGNGEIGNPGIKTAE